MKKKEVIKFIDSFEMFAFVQENPDGRLLFFFDPYDEEKQFWLQDTTTIVDVAKWVGDILCEYGINKGRFQKVAEFKKALEYNPLLGRE